MSVLSSIKALMNVVKLWDRVSELAEQVSVLEARMEHLEGRGGLPAFLDKYDVHHTQAGDTVYRSRGAGPLHYICPICATKAEHSLLQERGGILTCRPCNKQFDLTNEAQETRARAEEERSREIQDMASRLNRPRG